MAKYYVGSISFSDELYHHGITGMKWGVRRYQNADGSLTAQGKARYGYKVSSMSDEELRKAVNRSRMENRYETLRSGSRGRVNKGLGLASKAADIANEAINTFGKEGLKAGKIAGGSSKIFGGVRDLSKKAPKRKRYGSEYSSLSDDELRRRIDRLQLERDYNEIVKNTSSIDKGMDVAKDILSVVGSVVAITGGIITIKKAFGHSDFFFMSRGDS